MALGLDHIQLAIPKGSEDMCRAFWCETLGLAELEKPDALRARGGMWLALAGVELHLGVEDPFRPAAKAHPGFLTTDIDTLAQKLDAAGHTPRWDTRIKGRRRFFCDDPFGNRLEFLQED